MKKLVMALTMLAGLPMSAMAQLNSHLPVTPENEIVSNLFGIPDSEAHQHFRMDLTKGNYLLIDFRRLSDWHSEDSGCFPQILRTAMMMVGRYKSQMQNSLSSKRLDISIPINNEPVTTRFWEHTENTNLQVFTEHDNAPLKVGMDTVRVLKNISKYEMHWESLSGGTHRDVNKNSQVQYTFLFKDIDQINDLAADENWIKQTVVVMNKMVKFYDGAWKKPDKWPHYTSLSVNPADTNIVKLEKRAFNIPHYLAVNLDGSVGVSLVRNTLAPNIDLGINYRINITKEKYLIQRISWSNLYVYEKQDKNAYKGNLTSMLNYELGVGNEDRYVGSIGAGFRLNGTSKQFSDDPSTPGNLYKIFFRYAINKAIIFSPEFYHVPNHKDQNWLGMTLSFRFF